jgi:hypothetical protein
VDEGSAPAGHPIGWPRAIASALVVGAVAFGLLVWLPNAILVRFTGLDRGQRVGIATAVFAVGLVLLAWALRRLQRRHVI